MIAKFAFFPTASGFGFAVFVESDENTTKFVQSINLKNGNISGFSKVHFSDDELIQIDPPHKFHEIGMSGVVAERSRLGDIKLKPMPKIDFDFNFCNSLNQKEKRSYLNSVVRELGWQSIAGKARDEKESEYIKHNLSCLDFEIGDGGALSFKDFSGQFKGTDSIVLGAIEDIKFYIKELGLSEVLIDGRRQQNIEDETDQKINNENLRSFIRSSKRQEERLAQFLYIVVSCENIKQRSAFLYNYQDRAKFANSVINFFRLRISEGDSRETIVLLIAKNINGFYNSCYWSNRVQLLYEFAFYFRDYKVIVNAIKSILGRSRSFPIYEHKNSILKILSSEKGPSDFFIDKLLLQSSDPYLDNIRFELARKSRGMKKLK